MNRKDRRRAEAAERDALKQVIKTAQARDLSGLTEADEADIVVIVLDGVVADVIAPPGLSIQLRDYDPASAWAKDSTEHRCRSTGDVYGASWIKEPGAANAE